MNLNDKQKDDQLTFKVEKFEGPLDLLLHLIKQNKMDIYDIPMAEITTQYVAYLHQMQKLQLDIAGEYLVTAAMLLNIKSKMLLPNEQTVENEEVDDYEDPRDELVQQLLLHETFQIAGENLGKLATERQLQYSREEASVPDDVKLGKLSDEELSINLLQQAFSRLLIKNKIDKPVQRKLETEKFTIKDEIVRIKKYIRKFDHPIKFRNLFDKVIEPEKLVTTFLALLELSKQGEVLVSQAEQLGPIILERGK